MLWTPDHLGDSSQSPDGDFFDPEFFFQKGEKSQSPDGDFFDPEGHIMQTSVRGRYMSQSPDGDFFDPESMPVFGQAPSIFCHSPLTGIFLIRRTAERTRQRGDGQVTVP